MLAYFIRLVNLWNKRKEQKREEEKKTQRMESANKLYNESYYIFPQRQSNNKIHIYLLRVRRYNESNLYADLEIGN